ncbi:MAG: alpha-ketoacid dehydrogenase subunit beta, partial [Actinobacteria bacterium]|nr:alpha-ketoacid dehydrogenase subunit beta [Actinomycetota bacterium]NIS37073.1 alpha-ketoacid dehydrogenase subunit beta [Actinomycetota bacterium]NIU21397.1 alpha-ketoacid dehydrogenase subunit beta [Actinomycetota bacterium]NIU71542.1 alpha-ketoacid dehydrogenase subunit beta [Actinomycetota bacterium]NIV90902.1 alpha-ketoacid dehydrogenase subunit beta [Actinomycetota bacterium]
AASVERSGTDLSLIAYGAMMRESRRAADELESQGVSVELIDVRTLSPFDAETVVGSVAETGRAVV